MKMPKFNIGWLLPIVVMLVGPGMYLLDPQPLQVLRNTVFDQYQRWAPRVYQEAPVRIVDIDDESLNLVGQWPWPRTRIAELIERLRSMGAAAVVFDVLFAEPDRTSPAALLSVWDTAGPELRAHLAGLPDHDTVLAHTLAGGGVVLGHALMREGEPPGHFATPFRVINLGPSPLPFLHAFKGTLTPLPALQDATAGNGAITFIPDSDGVVRRVPLLLRMGDLAVPSLATEALRVGQGQRNIMVRTAEEAGAGLQSVRIGELEIPTTAKGEFWVHYTPYRQDRYVPAWKVLKGQAPAERLNGHIVLVGSSAQGLLDLRFSPLGGLIPGVEAHAQGLEQMLLGAHLTRPNWAPGLEMMSILVGGVLVGFLGLSTGALLSATAAVITLAVTGGGAWYAYAHHGLLLDPVTPSLALLFIFILTSLLHHAATEKRQRFVKQAFARYVSPNLVSHLVDNPGQLELGGNRRECSFIFTDLAGFTGLMEKLDPSDAVAQLNGYLDNMIRIAFEHEGTLDRIVGDAVAIMFSAPVVQPDHRQRALRCALAMHRFARTHATEANANGIPFGATRIGIHTGEVTVGNFGGSTIFDYRALGDPVNTAARLESVNKQLGTLVCVSEATLSGCTDAAVRSVGRLVLKGKTKSLMVFEPLFVEEGAGPTDDTYEAAYALMESGAPEAPAVFEQLAVERPADGLVAFHLKRLRQGETGDTIVFDSK
ncbi:MAG: CHASE2 domain-containing protein [Thiobacillus sp.]